MKTNGRGWEFTGKRLGKQLLWHRPARAPLSPGSDLEGSSCVSWGPAMQAWELNSGPQCPRKSLLCWYVCSRSAGGKDRRTAGVHQAATVDQDDFPALCETLYCEVLRFSLSLSLLMVRATLESIELNLWLSFHPWQTSGFYKFFPGGYQFILFVS